MLCLDFNWVRRQPLVTLLIFLLFGQNAYAIPEEEEWIRVKSDKLEMRIRGEILDVDGQPALAPSVSVSICDNNSNEPVDATLDGHRFEIWLPVHRVDWHTVRIQAVSKDSLRRASVRLHSPELRQTAMNGLTMTLQPSGRIVKAKMMKDDTPIGDADLKVQTSTGAVLHFKSDPTGNVQIGLLPDERIESLTGWTDQPLFGGFQFDREPVRDEKADTQTIELFACRDQKFRVVDGQGNPCGNVEIFLHVATPPPNYNYLGNIEASRMVTNKDGEANFRWFPDWKDIHCYVDLKSDKWVIDGRARWVNGDFVVQVKQRAMRRRVWGRFERDKGSKAGYHVSWRSFQAEQENRSDFISCVTDQQGNFSADVLPGATYCVFINDTRDVSDMIDLIPAPIDEALATTAVLHLQQPETLTIRVTAGAMKRPIANQPIYVRQTHDYQWMENGAQQSGASARDRYVYTDERGVATAAVESGKEVEVSIYNADWNTSEEKLILAGGPNSVDLHREIDEPRTVLGVVLQDKDHPVSTDEITIVAGAVDGETIGNKKLVLRGDGVFQMQTRAMAVGALATTKDQSMAGVVVAENPQRIMRLYLRPTQQIRGRLVDPKGSPIVGRNVYALVRVMLESKDRELNAFHGFEAYRQTVKTDADGYYTFSGMPIDVQIALSVESTSKVENRWLGTVELKGNEEQAVKTHTIDE